MGRILAGYSAAANIKVNGQKDFKVHILDFDGLRTDNTMRVHKGKFRIDDSKCQTIWYEIVK